MDDSLTPDGEVLMLSSVGSPLPGPLPLPGPPLLLLPPPGGPPPMGGPLPSEGGPHTSPEEERHQSHVIRDLYCLGYDDHVI